jgi:hypothetical protein
MSWEWFKRYVRFLMGMKSDNSRFNGPKKPFKNFPLTQPREGPHLPWT